MTTRIMTIALINPTCVCGHGLMHHVVVSGPYTAMFRTDGVCEAEKCSCDQFEEDELVPQSSFRDESKQPAKKVKKKAKKRK